MGKNVFGQTIFRASMSLVCKCEFLKLGNNSDNFLGCSLACERNNFVGWNFTLKIIRNAAYISL